MMRHLVVTSIALALAGCNSTQIQTEEVSVVNRSSTASVSRDASDFSDADIEVPPYFDTQGLERCTFDPENEVDGCPLKKPIIRVYFEGNRVEGDGKGVEALQSLDNLQLSKMFENQVAGLSRFRILTRDDQVVVSEQAQRLAEQGAAEVIQQAAVNRVIKTDYIFKIDTVKTANTFYGEYNGQATYGLELTSAVIDPFTKEKMSAPNLGKIRVHSNEVRDPKTTTFAEVNGRYYTGFDYTNKTVVTSVLNDMASRGFDLMLTRMLSEMPSTAQVLGIKGDQVSLDRGQNAGLLPHETMIIFQYEAGFVDPIGVVDVVPSKHSANGMIKRWKRSKTAKSIKSQAEDGIFRPGNDAKIFAISVGTPNNFLKSRT
ncbi:hypothetical protein [Ferrimonas lipolytica]|uniref:Uncharacterized protein n=1 Tax=Ferrimonas lipolytica TaxID=2724191 RepID=A0A6H1UH19_9GAMM|nr:hypothetical protein [Ferrimonas lipolytica]QIZ78381.1 hypothetical protein HER31_16615 [Ferrimonas lipolytica]